MNKDRPAKRDTSAPRKLSPIPFRVTEEERQKLAEAAARVGLTLSAYIRARVLEETPTMRATRKPSVEAEALAKLLGQVGKIASDIRQLVSVKGGGGENGLLGTLAETREAAALKEHGYVLARGDKSQFCIVDKAGDCHSLARRISGIKIAELRAFMQDVGSTTLPTVAEARMAITGRRSRKQSTKESPENA